MLTKLAIIAIPTSAKDSIVICQLFVAKQIQFSTYRSCAKVAELIE
jgi:hypothetical protein